MEFGEYWKIVTKRGWILVVVALVGAIAGFGLSQVLPETYRATIQLSVEPERPSEGLNQTARDLLYNYAVKLRSHSMTQVAIDHAGLEISSDEFLADLEVTPDTSSLILTISAESGDPEQARLMAQSLAEVFVENRRAWNEEIDAQDRIYTSIVDGIRYVPLVSPLWKFNTLAGGVFGLARRGAGGTGRVLVVARFGRGLPEAAAIGVAVRGMLVLFGVADAGRVGGVLVGFRLPLLRDRILLRSFRLAARRLRERRAGSAADQSTNWSHAHGRAPVAGG